MADEKSCSSKKGAQNVTIKIPLPLYNKLSYVCSELKVNRGEIIRELLYDSLPIVIAYLETFDDNVPDFDKSSALSNFHHDSLSKIVDFVI